MKTTEEAVNRGLSMVFPVADLNYRLKNYLSSALLVWLGVLFFRTDSYFKHYLMHQSQVVIFYSALAYTVFGLFFYLFLPSEKLTKSRGYIVLSALKRLAVDSTTYLSNFTRNLSYPLPRVQEEERVAILFVLVKIIFIPLMLNFVMVNYFALKADINRFNGNSAPIFSIEYFNLLLYPVLISAYFLIDTGIFAFGYMVESRIFKNQVKSVEPTALGWIVALMCYAPLLAITTTFAPLYQNDYISFSSSKVTFLVRLLLVILYFIYVSASVALGPKASNLTNRGIVGRGPYSLVRHPAYISKNIAWWITIIPIFNLGVLASMIVWSVIYFLRSITEERHLLRDPAYKEYCKKVRWRFVPGVY